jgi:hypothetical protein
MVKKLLRNRLKCKKCGDIIESTYAHDFKYCKCGAIFIDGGLEYSRYGWLGGDRSDYIENLQEWEE